MKADFSRAQLQLKPDFSNLVQLEADFSNCGAGQVQLNVDFSRTRPAGNSN